LVYDEISKNRTKSFFLILFFSVFVMVACYFIGQMSGMGGSFGLFVGFWISLIMSLVSYYSGSNLLLASVGAKEADPVKYPELVHVVEEMKLSSGLPMPKVYVVPDPSPNAFASGRDPNHAVICVNEGLLRLLNREELQGVIAHEMSHIQNRDILFATVVSVLLGILIIGSRYFLRFGLFGGGRRRNNDSGGGDGISLIIGLALIILAPILGQLIQMAISRQREYLADASGAFMSRNPSGLASALRKISGSQVPSNTTNGAVAALYFAKPFNVRTLFSTHPPIEERIARLDQMGYN
jgi:heat shock protein HtpX